MQTEALDYLDGTQRLSGMLVHNGTKESRPGVVLFPDARGIGDHAIEHGRRHESHMGIDGRLAVRRDTLERESAGSTRRVGFPRNRQRC